MSFPKKGRKFRPISGKTFPKSSDTVSESGRPKFATVIAETLGAAFGRTGGSIKSVMAYTGAGERTVKNRFNGKNGPNGENLVQLMRHSDEVLEAMLMMAGREEILAGMLLVDARDKLVEMLEIVDRMRADKSVSSPPGNQGLN